VGREVQPAECVEPQPPAKARLGHGPDQERHVERIGRRDRHRGVGEGDLEDQEPVDACLLQVGQRGGRRVGVEEEPPRSHDLVPRPVEQREHGGKPFLGEGDVEGRAAEGEDADLHQSPA
jgi:hypothetical protein